jgi:hypothetical protein
MDRFSNWILQILGRPDSDNVYVALLIQGSEGVNMPPSGESKSGIPMERSISKAWQTLLQTSSSVARGGAPRSSTQELVGSDTRFFTTLFGFAVGLGKVRVLDTNFC